MSHPTAVLDVDAIDAFLALHAHSAMYLRAELRKPGAAANVAVAREDGRIVGVAAQVASGMVVLQAPLRAGELGANLVRRSGRRLAGFYGPAQQVRCALDEMGLAGVPLLKDTVEDLFALALDDLRLAPVLAHGQARCRVAHAGDAALLVAWRRDFRRTTLNDVDGEQLDAASRADIEALLPAGSLFMLEGEGPLACCSFNARLPDMVQVGNVWTPPALRGHGYAQAVVGGALALAAKQGVATAVLSTGRHNAPAQAAYRSLGFSVAGDYATVCIGRDAELPALYAG